MRYFSIYLHKPSSSGISLQTHLNKRINKKYNFDGEIDGTYIEVDRSNTQSVINAIASITYYMQKFNAFVIIQEGQLGQNINSLVMCFDQRKIYRPDVIQSFGTGRIARKFLSSYSEVHYNNWVDQYNQIFNIGNIYPLYLFHDVDKLPQLIVDSLRIYLGVNSQLIKLLKTR